MKFACLFLLFTGLLHSQEVLKSVKDRSQRGTLSDQRQLVRGDTGKWNDTAMLLHSTKAAGKSLDDWIDEIAEKKPVVTAGDENWLLFRTRQLEAMRD